MKYYIRSLMLVAGLGLAKGGDAASIVDWGGDYVPESTSNSNLSGTLGDYTVPGTALWVYGADDGDGEPRTSPTSDYVAPAGKSAKFSWGGYTQATDTNLNPSQRNWSRAGVLDSIYTPVDSDTIDFFRGNNNASYSFIGAAFVSFAKEDFLNGYDALTLDMGGVETLSVSGTGITGSVTYRFAVLSDGIWYLGEDSMSSNGSLILTGEDLSTSNWAEWSPTGGADSRLEDVPGSFGTSVAELDDIQGFGVYADMSAANGSSMRFEISEFGVEAIPEPQEMAFLLGMSCLVLSLVRRRNCKRN
tara:strand:- start:22674 stop:23582 length:909 start_codon:yes stop_codon:yes gene_type:complete